MAYDVARLAKYYNNALLIIESNTLETHDQERDTDGASADYILDIISRIYRNENGRYNATPGEGNHDDVLMSRAIALYVCYFEMKPPAWADESIGMRDSQIDSNSAAHF